MSHVPLGTARFRFVQGETGETLVIPALRNIVTLPFLIFWLMGWTIGGVTTISALFSQFQPFLAVWTLLWAISWATAVCVLAWMLRGKEHIRFCGRDLEIGFSMPGFERRQLYRGADIRDLEVAPPNGYRLGRPAPSNPLFGPAGGVVRFTYGARTRSFAHGLDEAEARAILSWLRKGLADA